MKTLKTLLRIALFVIGCFFLFRQFDRVEKEMDEKNSVYLKNDVLFGGVVSDVKVSRNHRFGVVTLRIANHDLPIFNKSSPENKVMMFPYKLQHGVAEVYDLVPPELSVGDSIYLNSKERVIKYFFTKNNRQCASLLKMVTSGTDADFVNENSKLKSVEYNN